MRTCSHLNLRTWKAAERDGALCALELEAGARADEFAIELDRQLARARLSTVVLRADLVANLALDHGRDLNCTIQAFRLINQRVQADTPHARELRLLMPESSLSSLPNGVNVRMRDL